VVRRPGEPARRASEFRDHDGGGRSAAVGACFRLGRHPGTPWLQHRDACGFRLPASCSWTGAGAVPGPVQGGTGGPHHRPSSRRNPKAVQAHRHRSVGRTCAGPGAGPSFAGGAKEGFAFFPWRGPRRFQPRGTHGGRVRQGFPLTRSRWQTASQVYRADEGEQAGGRAAVRRTSSDLAMSRTLLRRGC